MEGERRGAGQPVLRPLPSARIATGLGLGGGAVLVGVPAALVGFSPEPLAVGCAVVLLIAGPLVAARSAWIGVRCTANAARVQGLLWSRTVPRRSIVAVTPLPALVWRDARGRRRWSPMWALGSGRGGRRYREHNRQQLGRLERWYRAG